MAIILDDPIQIQSTKFRTIEVAPEALLGMCKPAGENTSWQTVSGAPSNSQLVECHINDWGRIELTVASDDFTEATPATLEVTQRQYTFYKPIPEIQEQLWRLEQLEK